MKTFTLERQPASEPSPAARDNHSKPTDEQLFVARVGAATRALRFAKRMRQDQLARAAGISLSTLARFERGESAGTVITTAAVERGLGLKCGFLMRLGDMSR